MLEILYEDNHCLAVNKPAGLLSQGDYSGDASLVELAKADLKTRFQKPGNVYVGLVHRLDRPVSGVVLLARTSKAAERLSAQFRAGTIEKTYLAWVEGVVSEESGEWVDYLVKDAVRNVVEAGEPGGGGKEAVLEFRTLERQMRSTLLELRPRTGRSHQLRVQLASRGWPIVGDRKYGASGSLRAAAGGLRIALHASRLGFSHPTQKRWIEVFAPEPSDWPGPRPRG
jgi:23S rRNA pseudouridine1911/1915/1917 synthase